MDRRNNWIRPSAYRRSCLSLASRLRLDLGFFANIRVCYFAMAIEEGLLPGILRLTNCSFFCTRVLAYGAGIPPCYAAAAERA
jgi:hypothetical protein